VRYTLANVCVVGGGAAGVMAAISAAENGADVTILEKNEKLHKKLFITGKGRCNITNTAYYEDFLRNILRGKKFFMSSFNNFDNYAVMDFFEDNDLKLKEERGGRVFPASDKSSDVIKVFEKKINELNINVKQNYEVKDIKKLEDSFMINDSLQFDRIIISSGGCTYKSTGSSGSMYKIAQVLGQKITNITHGLSAIVNE